jgi:hypothetical protein
MNTDIVPTLSPPTGQVEELLDLVIQEVQLTESQHDDAKVKYGEVTKWLAAPGSPVRSLSPNIYPQGSLRLETTVRPWHHIEFDLDLVCEITPTHRMEPLEAYDLLLARMEASEIYAPILEPKYRCIRLNYAKNFHLDIVPAIPDPNRAAGSTAILIPDRDKAAWHSSNPLGYAKWFLDNTVIPVTKRVLADARIEPLGDPEPLDGKAPLKLAVQLVKRARDVAFMSQPELSPSSIILTTLAATMYGKEETATHAFTAVLDRCHALASRGPFHVANPANPGESFTDCWCTNPASYAAFVEKLGALRQRWRTEVLGSDFVTASRALKEIFGQAPVGAALSKYADRRTHAREQGRLFASRQSGALITGATAGSVRVPGHTFYGGSDDE